MFIVTLIAYNRVIHSVLPENMRIQPKGSYLEFQNFTIYNLICVVVFSVFPNICLVLILSPWLRKHL